MGEQKLKKYWMQLVGQELFTYKNPESTEAKSVHIMKNVFVKEEKPHRLENDSEIFAFSLIYPQKKRSYFLLTMEDRNHWVRNLRLAIGSKFVTEKYDAFALLTVFCMSRYSV